MGYGIIRVAKRKSSGAVRAMLLHALREVTVPNADADAEPPTVLMGESSTGAAMARLRSALKAAPRVRKDTVQALDVLVTASREDIMEWPRERQEAYFDRALIYVAARFGGAENVLTAAIHWDESTPHMQVIVMPRDHQTGAFIGGKLLGGPPGLRRMHDEFHTIVGQSFGLLRGERGIGVKHVPIRQFYAHIEGQESPIPEYVEVPPEPSMADRMAGRSAAMWQAIDKAKAHNAKVRQDLAALAATAKKIHPQVLRQQSERYRAALAAEGRAKQAIQQAKDERQGMQRHAEAVRAQVQKDTATLRQVQAETQAERQAQEALQAKLQEGWTLPLIDRFTKQLRPEYVARLAQILRLELVAGRGLVDQVRKGLKLPSGARAVERLEAASEEIGGGSLIEAAMGAERRRQEGQERQKGG